MQPDKFDEDAYEAMTAAMDAMIKAAEWVAIRPRQFIDRRMRLTRESGIVRQSVRAFRGQIVRRGEDGKAEYDHCGHAHNKLKVARQCAEREARRRNRELKKQAT
jgi:hypothetical protein